MSSFGEEGSPAAITAILAKVQRPLYVFVHGLVHENEHARDIVQDVLHDAWHSTRQGRTPFVGAAEEAEIRRWLFHVAYCKAVSALRHRRLIRWHSLEVDVGEYEHPRVPEPFEDQVVERAVVQAALASLTSEEAACLLLNVVQGFTAVEIAQILGISPEAGKKRLSRAKQRLRAAYFAQDSEIQEP